MVGACGAGAGGGVGVRDGLGPLGGVLARAASRAGGVACALPDAARSGLVAGGEQLGGPDGWGGGLAGETAGADVVGAPSGVRLGRGLVDGARRVIQGCREVDDDPSWRGEVQWSDRRGRHRVGHCPDLVVRGTTPVEVELARKSDARLAGVMVMYRGWVAAGRIPGVMYVVESQADAERIRTVAARHELNMRVELLEVIVAQALEASGARATTP